MRSPRLGVFATVLFGCSTALGATITVATTAPGVVADGMCSLLEAVNNANDGDVHTDCVAGDDGLDVIELLPEATFPPGFYNYTFRDDVMINGNGSTLLPPLTVTTVVIEGSVAMLNDLSFHSLGAAVQSTILVNRCEIEFLGISDDVTATLTHCVAPVIVIGRDRVDLTLRGCLVAWVDVGGGSRIVMRDSFVTSRGVQIRGGAFVDMAGCTIASGDVGVRMEGAGTVSIARSTFTGNAHGVVLAVPSGVPGSTTLDIRDSTFVGNACGISLESGSRHPLLHAQVSLQNTIIAAAGSGCRIEERIDAEMISHGFNVTTDDSCGLDHHTDMVVADVRLSDLDDLGGPTPVHMPLEGSPAVDMGGECSGTDQRGYLRPADGDGDGVAVCDCGAVEYRAEPRPRPPWLPRHRQLPPAFE